MSYRMIITDNELAHINAQAVSQYPTVCCGVLLTRPGTPNDRLIIACRNAQDEARREDPEIYSLTCRDGYYVSPFDLLTIAKREAEGYVVSALYYSRIDRDASFSETSRRAAIIDGEPVFPETTYLPVSVLRGSVVEIRAFKWDAASRDFAEAFLDVKARRAM